ncbi:MAG: hypothetical protein QY332_10745 [Anaerolineales bacterium]|nr:MAG: hypothetical protein QY332_10745 [Anaerolineales bacterium]
MKKEVERFIQWVRMRNPQAKTWRDYQCDMNLFLEVAGRREAVYQAAAADNRQAGRCACIATPLAAHFCDSIVERWLQGNIDPEVVGTQESEHDHDLCPGAGTHCDEGLPGSDGDH